MVHSLNYTGDMRAYQMGHGTWSFNFKFGMRHGELPFKGPKGMKGSPCCQPSIENKDTFVISLSEIRNLSVRIVKTL